MITRIMNASKLPPICGLLTLVCCSTSSHAELTLAQIFTNHAVIQANKPIKVWGTSDKKKQITLNLGGATKTVAVDASGHWLADFDPIAASYTPFDLRVTDGTTTITKKNLVAGEVWLATGQSNMQWMLSQSAGGEEAIKESNDPNLRLLLYSGKLHPGGNKYSRDFLINLNKDNYYRSSRWQTCTAGSASSFSAVAYYFAKKLRQKLNVPVGIIALPVGGSPIEAHLPEDAFTSDQKLKPLLKNWWKNPAYPQWCRQRAAYNLTHWLSNPEKGKDPPHPFAPTFLWRAGIEPLLDFPIAGIIWYQGESNATIDGNTGKALPKEINHRKLTALVNAYRRHWNNDSLPFYPVQLPGLNRPWALFREMQHDVTQELTNVGMAVAIDVGHPTNVHPSHKKPVGDRLSRLALNHIYGKNIPCHGPLPEQLSVQKTGITIKFSHADGLTTSDNTPPRAFELAGGDGIFHPATAEIINDTIFLTNNKITHPNSVRYAWSNYPDVNLVNSSGLPAHPFRRKIK